LNLKKIEKMVIEKKNFLIDLKIIFEKKQYFVNEKNIIENIILKLKNNFLEKKIFFKLDSIGCGSNYSFIYNKSLFFN
jgi:uncharacterized LabA/DUF88 family protein